MSFQLVPKSVTLNELERRNGPVVFVILPNSEALELYYAKLVEDTPYILRVKCSPKNLDFSGISLMVIFAGDHPRARALK